RGEKMDKKKINDEVCSDRIEKALDYEFYKVLFDPVRTKIMAYLGANGARSISEIAEHFPQDRTVISRHLSLMNRYGILEKKKKSREYIYYLNAEFVIEKFDQTTNSLKELARNS
ncbi:ArsR/SmtB family transcription factor, partial [Enterococcus rivorum]